MSRDRDRDWEKARRRRSGPAFANLTSVEGRAHIHKGWKKTEIKAVVSGEKSLSPVDPYQSIYS
ncbi:hypothetical protein P5673_024724 [Acropora cervicornis]|uniref:Uncharacterized protein n=1 Tax=Acropora cervicornis TaxID=6130 RepID=A0AAD9Q3B2_ACRCE|nr:hypothetical protein P5673_024724 [Acropora cervicornis]